VSVSCECCVLSGISLCVGMITRPEKLYQVSACDCEAKILSRPWPTRGCCIVGEWGSTVCLCVCVYVEQALCRWETEQFSSMEDKGLLIAYYYHFFSVLGLDGLVRMNTGEGGEKLMVTIIQLLLLCIPVYNRIQLQYLLHFMNQWNLHHSLCAQSNVCIIHIHFIDS